MVAVTVYDTETRTLITHVIKPMGAKSLQGSTGTSAQAFETWAGFCEKPSLVYTDAEGNLLRYEAGPLVLRLSSAAEIEREFGRRRDAVNVRLEQERPSP
jgi:hypothetical protein